MFTVSVPDECHLEGVPLSVVAAVYAHVVLYWEKKPRRRRIVLETPSGEIERDVTLYLHPDTDDVMMQVAVE